MAILIHQGASTKLHLAEALIIHMAKGKSNSSAQPLHVSINKDTKAKRTNQNAPGTTYFDCSIALKPSLFYPNRQRKLLIPLMAAEEVTLNWLACNSLHLKAFRGLHV